jgi:hypothetical protein
MNTSSLHDYRLAYPMTSAWPTLSTNRDLAVMLQRRRQRILRQQRRAAQWKAFLQQITLKFQALKQALRHAATLSPTTTLQFVKTSRTFPPQRRMARALTPSL